MGTTPEKKTPILKSILTLKVLLKAYSKGGVSCILGPQVFFLVCAR